MVALFEYWLPVSVTWTKVMLATSDQAASASWVAAIWKLLNWLKPLVSVGMDGAEARKAYVTTAGWPGPGAQLRPVRVICPPASMMSYEGLPLGPKEPRSSPSWITP